MKILLLSYAYNILCHFSNKNIFIVLINKKTFEFIFKFRTSLHIDLLNKVLHQNYLFFVNQGFSKINNILSEEINNYSVNSVKPTINLFKKLLSALVYFYCHYTGHLENLIFIIPFIFLIILILKKINRSIQDWSKTRIQNKENLVKLKYGLIHGVKRF